MNIRILSSAKEVTSEIVKGKTAVVIDVLRATTVMVTALGRGASRIYPFKEIEEVRGAAKSFPDSLLGGERKGLKIEGFNFGNSPLEYREEIVKDRVILMTTSNGTRAIEAAKEASTLYIASFLNLNAVAKDLIAQERDIVIICAGTDDEFSLDDALCAGMIADKVRQKRDVQMDDFTLAIVKLAHEVKDVKDTLKGSKHFTYLETLGFIEDLDYCFQRDIYDIVPIYTKKEENSEGIFSFISNNITSEDKN